MLRQRHPCGFTLVELLVVIGIIAVLIAVLLPALTAARRAAAQAKCAASLREIGNAFKFYEQEYGAYAPASRLYFDGGTYTINGFTYNSLNTATSTNLPCFWFNFLAKYVTRTKVGGAGNANGATASEQLKTILWGCPAWDPYYNGSASNAGFNVTQPGYGMNGFPEYQADFPPNQGDELGEAGTYAQLVNTPRWNKKVTANRWYKLAKWNHSAERALAGDALFWFIEARPPYASAGDQAKLGQYTLANTGTWSAGGAGDGAHQTTFDWYRHGTYPGRQTNDEFKSTGGKIAYNILYADGHVSGAVDKETAYKSVRMRYP
jgi:prepilin-type N-terminal cleavage/methylation domain-containing protein/prepilin-type processing-associated H-X9-DG protein